MLAAGHVRPTALSPVWNAAGFALGAATALLGEKAAHACTEAVETVIEEHYGDQVAVVRQKIPKVGERLCSSGGNPLGRAAPRHVALH